MKILFYPNGWEHHKVLTKRQFEKRYNKPVTFYLRDEQLKLPLIYVCDDPFDWEIRNKINPLIAFSLEELRQDFINSGEEI